MNVGSIFVALGFKANTKDLNTFNAGIKSLKTNILTTSVAFTGAVYSIKKFLDSGIQIASIMTNFTNQTGLAINKLNQFTSAGQSVSLKLNAEGITNDIMNLEKTIARIRLGQGSIAPFQMLGIDVLGKDAFNVLEQLREKIKSLDTITATILLEDLGLNPNFLQILKLSNEEFAKLGKNNFFNSNQAKIVNQLGLNMRKLTNEFANLKNQAIVKLAPYFNELINKTFKWLQANGEKITKVISDIARGFGIFIQGISKGIKFAGELVEKFLGIENGLKAIGLAIAILMTPFKKLFLIFGLLEDIARWKSGKTSAFGDVYERFDSFFGEINQMTERIKGVFDIIIQKIDAIVSKMSPFKKLFGIAENENEINAEKSVTKLLLASTVGSVGEWFAKLPHWFSVPGEKGIKDNLNYTKSFAEEKAKWIMEQLGHKGNNVNNITNNNNFVINEAKNPTQTANSIESAIKIGTSNALNSI